MGAIAYNPTVAFTPGDVVMAIDNRMSCGWLTAGSYYSVLQVTPTGKLYLRHHASGAVIPYLFGPARFSYAYSLRRTH